MRVRVRVWVVVVSWGRRVMDGSGCKSRRTSLHDKEAVAPESVGG